MMYLQNFYLKLICLIFIIFLSLSSLPHAYSSEIPTVYLLLPGGTYFYEGDYKTGAAFAIPEVGFLTTGILINDKMGKQDKTSELNVPSLLAFQLYAVDKWSYFQKVALREKSENTEFKLKIDDTPLSELMLAPFKKEVVSSPLVVAFALLGIADGIYGYPESKRSFSDVANITAMGNKMSRDTGTGYYEGMAFAVSYGAGVSEEMLFRGFMLPVIDYKYGKRTGLVSSSLTFGLLHAFNPALHNPAYTVAQATLAGFIFGYSVQRDDYKLSKAIAAHFWYDFISMTTTWLANPNENPLGVQVEFRF
jgi:membrane protease YdiL (CAAX protease family)